MTDREKLTFLLYEFGKRAESEKPLEQVRLIRRLMATTWGAEHGWGIDAYNKLKKMAVSY